MCVSLVTITRRPQKIAAEFFPLLNLNTQCDLSQSVKRGNAEKKNKQTHTLSEKQKRQRHVLLQGATVTRSYCVKLCILNSFTSCYSAVFVHHSDCTHTETHTRLTGKLSLMASTGAWKGHAKLCFHNVFNTTFCKYWKRAKTNKQKIIHTLNKWNWHFTSRDGSQSKVLPAAGWSVVWVWRGSMFRGVEGWRG